MPESAGVTDTSRRIFLRLAMGGGLAAGYGTFASLAAQYLYSGGGETSRWQFVVPTDGLALGDSLSYVAPNGAKLVITRQSEGDDADSFMALSSVCPHLGCQVHWEPQHERFFCPCHNGAFDREGNPTEGPPKAANQVLTRFPLKVEGGLLYVETSWIFLSARPRADARLLACRQALESSAGGLTG